MSEIEKVKDKEKIKGMESSIYYHTTSYLKLLSNKIVKMHYYKIANTL